MKFLEGFIKKKSQAEPIRILPEDVRYALNYKEGVFNKADLETLLNSGFINETLYLTFKSLDGFEDKQKHLLEKYVSLISNESALVDKKKLLEDLLSKALKEENEIAVKGHKLAQISRQDFSLWEKKFESTAENLSTTDKNVYLLAYATFLGLRSFIKSFREKDKTLNILMPNWIKDGKGKIGYRIDFNSGRPKVSILEEPFPKSNAIIVDDTVGTGGSFERIIDYWESKGGEKPETLVVGQI